MAKLAHLSTPPRYEQQEGFELLVQASRAELSQTLAPGLVHSLANARQGLAVVGRSPGAYEGVGTRLEHATRVLNVLARAAVARGVPAGGCAPFAVGDLLNDAAACEQAQITLPRVPVRFVNAAPLPTAHGRADELLHAVLELITNAKRALAGHDAACVEVTAAATGRWITISVRDNGPGIPIGILANLYTPPSQLAGRDGRLGIGLLVARRIARRSGGELRVAVSRVRRGTRVALEIPVWADA